MNNWQKSQKGLMIDLRVKCTCPSSLSCSQVIKQGCFTSGSERLVARGILCGKHMHGDGKISEVVGLQSLCRRLVWLIPAPRQVNVSMHSQVYC